MNPANPARKYPFRWELLGNLRLGRPNLGPITSLYAYRLMVYTFRDVLEQTLGTEQADRIFYDAGRLAGKQFYQNALKPTGSLSEFIRELTSALREWGMGILRIEKLDLENGEIILTVSEDLDCSGLPELDYEVCVYDEGFICGLLESYTGSPFRVEEIDCWCSGDRTCRFRAEVVSLPAFAA
ncbi:MAG: V4R domain-containing protein [Anaerolineales bacterium]|nr:4-vinyl reductase [Anaerolineales bacterium]MCS7248211.1 4-vinyl reductase [Anaerolineales bacterium]MDW8162024.1 V4R domain-containing protein [Anaerolineales bacterium]MDW8445900.1 V4R domain-containing protein [Anaerolineales bacterium]